MADAIYSPVRQDDRLCMLVIICITKHVGKQLVAVKMLIESQKRTGQTS
ncbi:MAG: hypothetical protein ACTS73_04150 [Arsenophonus sp. NEOnobi-MAG3]